MAAQLVLLDRPLRRAPRKLMHVVDAGSGMVHFRCGRCGHDSGWVKAGKLSDDKRGRPCPWCNQPPEAEGTE
jgi:hypothetical protein